MFSRPVAFAVAGTTGAATLTAASAPSPLYPVYQRLFGFSSFTLTLIFAVYVFALLAALLTVGSLSDRVGRRPVACAALVLLAVGMVLFTTAEGTAGLIAARVVQGFAVGMATGTTTAMITDTAPGRRSGSILSSAAPPLGITIGAVLSGALVEFAPQPRRLVFWVLSIAFVVLAALIWFVPDHARSESATHGSTLRSLVPSAGLPRQTRPVFFSLLPLIGATWALAGLYLSLGSSLLGTVLGVRSFFVVGLVLGVFFISGIAGTVVSTVLPEHLRTRFGYSTLAGGVLMTIAALLVTALPVYVVGSVVAGLGFGAALQYAVNALGTSAPAAHRGEVFATMYIASYLAFSVPALAAGIAVERFGLRPTSVVYGTAEVALVVAAALTEISRARRHRGEQSRLSPGSHHQAQEPA